MRSTLMIVVGVIFIAAGALVISYRGIPYTSREVVLNVGNLNATADLEKTKQVPPVVTGLVIAGGILLVIAGAGSSRKRA